MIDQGVVILGIPIPSSSPVFLTTVAVHVLAGLICVAAGAGAMLSRKAPGRHPAAGSVYYWSLLVVVLSMTALSLMRWPADNHLLVLGIASFAAGWIGRRARLGLRPGWVTAHVTGMALSYILLLTAFYVDNGPHLPLWRSLPRAAHWLLPAMVGLPILIWALTRHPLVSRLRSASRPPINALTQFTRALGFSEDAWDVYLLYGPSARWDGDLPPKPDF